MKKRGQSAIEFVVIWGVVLFFFIVFFSIIKINIQERDLAKERAFAQNIALDVQYEINLAAEASNGYSREFKVPNTIFGKDYEIQLVGEQVYVSGDKIGVSYKVVEVNGTIQKGVNAIQKKDGVIYLN